MQKPHSLSVHAFILDVFHPTILIPSDGVHLANSLLQSRSLILKMSANSISKSRLRFND